MTYLRINPVLALLLLLTAIAAALPFISYAPNRLVSGEGRHLWQLWPQTIWMLVGVCCAWLTACFIPAKKGSIFALILAQLVFVLLVWGAGKAATQLAQNGSALARTSLGSGFWLAAALALLPVAMPSDESPRIRCGAGCCICRLPSFRCGCCIPARLTISR